MSRLASLIWKLLIIKLVSIIKLVRTFRNRGVEGDMSPIEFSLQVILVSTSGVLSPGPLFFINILYGSKYGSFVGLKIASGHAIIEFPLIIALSYGLYSFSYTLYVSDIIFKFIGLTGGIFLLLFSMLQIISILKDKSTNSQTITNLKFNIKNPILVGLIFTIQERKDWVL